MYQKLNRYRQLEFIEDMDVAFPSKHLWLTSTQTGENVQLCTAEWFFTLVSDLSSGPCQLCTTLLRPLDITHSTPPSSETRIRSSVSSHIVETDVWHASWLANHPIHAALEFHWVFQAIMAAVYTLLHLPFAWIDNNISLGFPDHPLSIPFYISLLHELITVFHGEDTIFLQTHCPDLTSVEHPSVWPSDQWSGKNHEVSGSNPNPNGGKKIQGVFLISSKPWWVELSVTFARGR